MPLVERTEQLTRRATIVDALLTRSGGLMSTREIWLKTVHAKVTAQLAGIGQQMLQEGIYPTQLVVDPNLPDPVAIPLMEVPRGGHYGSNTYVTPYGKVLYVPIHHRINQGTRDEVRYLDWAHKEEFTTEQVLRDLGLIQGALVSNLTKTKSSIGQELQSSE
jgi:hypothetical protein